MAELVDAHGSGPCAARCGGSSPLLGTKHITWLAQAGYFFVPGTSETPACFAPLLVLRPHSIRRIPQCLAASRSNVVVWLHPASSANRSIKQSAKSALLSLNIRKAFHTVSACATIISLVRNSASNTSHISPLVDA